MYIAFYIGHWFFCAICNALQISENSKWWHLHYFILPNSCHKYHHMEKRQNVTFKCYANSIGEFISWPTHKFVIRILFYFRINTAIWNIFSKGLYFKICLAVRHFLSVFSFNSFRIPNKDSDGFIKEHHTKSKSLVFIVSSLASNLIKLVV